MFARLLATVCLLCAFVTVGRSEPRSAPDTPLGVYLKTGKEVSNLPIFYMKAELEALLAPAGIQLQWLTSEEATRSSHQKLLSVELRGSCRPTWSRVGVFKNHSALASTAVVDGQVLPFAWIDCTALNQFLGPDLPPDSAVERNQIYGRAMARLLAHEFYHMLLATQKHTRTGLSKEEFTVSDLLAPRLAFEPNVEARLRPAPSRTEQAASAPVVAPPAPLSPDTSVLDDSEAGFAR